MTIQCCEKKQTWHEIIIKTGWKIIQHFHNKDLQSRKFKFVLHMETI